MSIQYPTDESGDRISLKMYVDVFLNWKRLILGVIAGAILIASIFAFLIRSDEYTASTIISLPGDWHLAPHENAQTKTVYGWTQEAYKKFAQSNTVLNEVSRQTGIPAIELKGDFTIDMSTVGSLLMITVTAETHEKAILLTDEWIAGFHKMALIALTAELTKLTDGKISELETFTQEFAAAQTSLNEFNKVAQISLDKIKLEALEPELIRRKMRMDELAFRIPIYEKDVEFTKNSMDVEPKTLGVSAGGVSAGGVSAGGVSAGGVSAGGTIVDSHLSSGISISTATAIILNPIFLGLSEHLVEIRAALTNANSELTLLEPLILQLEQEGQELGNRIIDNLATEAVLTLTLEMKQLTYEIAVKAYHDLLTETMLIPEVGRARIVSEPAVEAPRVRRKNITLIGFAGLIGLILGTVLAFAIQRYKNETDIANKTEGSTNYKQTQNDG